MQDINGLCPNVTSVLRNILSAAMLVVGKSGKCACIIDSALCITEVSSYPGDKDFYQIFESDLINSFFRVLRMVYNIQDSWNFGFFHSPLS
jgi:hypothetical protein